MGTRLAELLDRYLQLTDSQAAKALGYRGSSTLWKIRHGSAFMDVEKLAVLATLGPHYARPNIHWLISGKGPPLVGAKRVQPALSDLMALFGRLTRKQRSALETLIAFASRKNYGRHRARRS
jgi:hypothetical protein